jgi:hypothetical protein
VLEKPHGSSGLKSHRTICGDGLAVGRQFGFKLRQGVVRQNNKKAGTMKTPCYSLAAL